MSDQVILEILAFMFVQLLAVEIRLAVYARRISGLERKQGGGRQ